MTYLLDTNVLSELRKGARRASPSVLAWAGRQRASTLSISVITAMEVEIGVRRRERRDPAAGAVLRRWFEHDVLALFAHRTWPVDLPAARRAAAMRVPDPRPERDALIAATALVRGLVVVTRDVADFSPLGAEVLDPWDG